MVQITRTDAAALLRDVTVLDMVEDLTRASVALSTFRTVTMPAKSARMPVLSALPTAGFVTEATDATGVKPASTMAWANVDLVAEEIAVIVPIHEDVLADESLDIWAAVRPLIAEEFGRVLDSAVLFGVNKPATWGDSVVEGARAAGNAYEQTAGEDLAEEINGAFAMVEADGFDVNAVYAPRSLRSQLRGLRDSQGQPIYLDNLRSDGSTASIYGVDVNYSRNGAWLPSEAAGAVEGANLIVGDRSKAILGIRQDITFKLLDQATVGGINLAERDMVALRAKFRVGYAVANPINRENTNAATRYPFAILTEEVAG